MKVRRTSWSRRKVTAMMVALAAVVALGIMAGTASGKSKATTLTVGVFGDFGYHTLYTQFEAANPGVTIKENSEGYGDHHSNLAKHLATGAGASDVEAIEIGSVAAYTNHPEYFVNLASAAASQKASYLPWKWAQGTATNGAVFGVGTDVGSLAICYRRDDMQQAGLPADRVKLGKLWPTWEKFLAAGVKFNNKAPAGVNFFDSGSNVFNAIANQQSPLYYDKAGNVIVSTNPKVKRAWNLTMKGIRLGLSAGLSAFSSDWNTGFKTGVFATVTCPAWMMGYIQGQAPDAAGLWDIAAVPGGGGSWGGSYLSVPEQGKNKDLAVKLALFLTSSESQLAVFKGTGNLPSRKNVLKSPEVQNFHNAFFHNAPVGKIFANTALALKPQVLGPHQTDFQTAVSNAIQRVEQHKQSATNSWKQFLQDCAAVV